MTGGDAIIQEETRQPAVMADDDRFILEFKAVTERLGKEGLEVKHFQAPREVPFPVSLKDDARGVIVGAADTIVELGHPITASFCFGLVTNRQDLIVEDQISVIGKDLEELPKGRHSVALIVLAQVAQPSEAARHTVIKCILSFDLLEGCMARVSSQRIWIRFNAEALDCGLTLKSMGAFLLYELKKNGFAIAEIIFVTGTAEHVNKIKLIAEGMAEERSARYREALVERMACESGLDCDECPETDTCKILKEAVARRRRA